MTLERLHAARAEEALDEISKTEVPVPRARAAREGQREIGERPRQQLEPRGMAMTEVSRIAREQFVAALAREHHRHVLRCEAREIPGWNQARVAERLIHVGERCQRLSPLVVIHRQLAMFGAEVSRHLACVLRLVVTVSRECQAERGEPAGAARGRGGYQARIESTREEHTERHLVRHAQLHRSFQLVPGAFDQ